MGKVILFWVGVAFVLSVPLTVGLMFDSPSLAWLAALCGAFITILSRFDDLAEVTMGPMQAKLRRAVQEAAATLEQVRELGVVTARATLTQLIAGEFMNGMSLGERMRIHRQVMEALGVLGVDRNGMERAQELWRKGVAIVYFRAIRAAIEMRQSPRDHKSQVSPELQSAGQEFQKLLDFDQWKVPAPVEIDNFVRTRNLMNMNVAAWIDDYRHFILTGETRRADIFAQQ